MMGDGVWRKMGGGWVIFCSQDWPGGVDLYAIKPDNQLSVKGIVMSRATESLDAPHVSSLAHQRAFTTEIKLGHIDAS